VSVQTDTRTEEKQHSSITGVQIKYLQTIYSQCLLSTEIVNFVRSSVRRGVSRGSVGAGAYPGRSIGCSRLDSEWVSCKCTPEGKSASPDDENWHSYWGDGAAFNFEDLVFRG